MWSERLGFLEVETAKGQGGPDCHEQQEPEKSQPVPHNCQIMKTPRSTSPMVSFVPGQPEVLAF